MNYQFLLETFFIALSGVPIALLVTVVALFIALPLGFLLALTRINKIPVIHHLAKIYPLCEEHQLLYKFSLFIVVFRLC